MRFRRAARQFNNQKIETCGYSFSSKLEAAVFMILKCRQQEGEISDIQVQDHVLICGPQGHECNSKCKIEYIADFKCTKPDGSVIHVEAKGYENERWPMKRRLWMHWGPNPLEVWKGNHTRPFLEEILKND